MSNHNSISKKWVLKYTTLYAVGILCVTFLLNLKIASRFFPYPARLDLHLAVFTITGSTVLIAVVFILIKKEKFFLPQIINKLAVLKDTLHELNQLEIIYVSALAGISEEIFFRGLLQGFSGIIIASVVFGVLHFLTFGYFLLTTMVGFYLGFIYIYSENINLPILVHTFYNIFAFNMLKHIYSEKFRI